MGNAVNQSPLSQHNSSRTNFHDTDEEGASGHERRAQLIDALCAASDGLSARGNQRMGRYVLPSPRATEAIVDDLRALLFPWHFGPPELMAATLRRDVGQRLERVRAALLEQVRRCLVFDCEHASAERRPDCRICDQRAAEASEHLIDSLPRIRGLLESDVQAAYDGDPAVRFLDEAVFCYPGVTAITQHRLAHELHLVGVPLLPRIVSELAHSRTGIDIHPGAQIGSSFFIDHGTGVVIGETCSIGQRVRIYQGVTLGARGFDEQDHLLKGIPRHPIVEDDVVIYAGATILGRITIGRGATIGGNVWLTRSVAAGGRVSQAHARHRLFRDGAGI
jgi:serine O-acetyltransferase